jgi:hypothetical protein
MGPCTNRESDPAQPIERDLSGLMVPPDHEQFLARRAVPVGRLIVDAGIADIETFDDAVAQWPAALDYPPAHEWSMVADA